MSLKAKDTKKGENKEEKQLPARRFKFGGVVITIWENEGKFGTYYTADIQRGFKDSEGEWKNTHSLRVNDIPKAVAGLQEAYSLIMRDVENE